MSGIIQNSRAIVTGGAQGIGFQICRHLLNKGAKAVVFLDINESEGMNSMKKLNDEFGQGRSSFLLTDVADATQLEKNFKQAVEQLGGLEILVNNAGIMDYSRWSLMIDLNFRSVVHGTFLGLNYMGKHKDGKGGTIINISSIASFYDECFTPVYAATKSAVLTFSRYIGKYHDKTGVAVKVMCPGRADTNLIFEKHDRFLDYLVDPTEAYEIINCLPSIKPEDVAAEVMQLITYPSPNAAFVKMEGRPTSIVEFPDFLKSLIPLDPSQR